MMNEGIFDIVTDVLQSQDKKLVITGYWCPCHLELYKSFLAVLI